MRLPTRLMLRVVIVGCLSAFSACSDSQDEGVDMTVDALACSDDLGSAFLAPVTCGPMTCAAGKLCMIFTPGVAPPPDAGDGYSYSCVSFPAECASCAAPRCGANPSASGCFSHLCQGEPNCKFKDATLTCIGI